MLWSWIFSASLCRCLANSYIDLKFIIFFNTSHWWRRCCNLNLFTDNSWWITKFLFFNFDPINTLSESILAIVFLELIFTFFITTSASGRLPFTCFLWYYFNTFISFTFAALIVWGHFYSLCFSVCFFSCFSGIIILFIYSIPVFVKFTTWLNVMKQIFHHLS
jgi:hypothetical protein